MVYDIKGYSWLFYFVVLIYGAMGAHSILEGDVLTALFLLVPGSILAASLLGFAIQTKEYIKDIDKRIASNKLKHSAVLALCAGGRAKILKKCAKYTT
ncbi:hypothetical protein DRJ25_03810 [Candidatus Woesearchaeota archaeon]|nr:MAG: hypothetical protein DRJ25_03810 [Candidatus Woesearchaeota archaeon]